MVKKVERWEAMNGQTYLTEKAAKQAELRSAIYELISGGETDSIIDRVVKYRADLVNLLFAFDATETPTLDARVDKPHPWRTS